MKNKKNYPINNLGTLMIKSYSVLKSLILLAFILLEFTFAQKGLAQTQNNSGTTERISWQRKFDDNDRLIKLIDPAGRETSFAYSNDLPGKSVVSKTNSEGNTVQQEYDEHDLLKTMKDASGVVNYQYDKSGRVIQVQRQGEAAIQYQYDVEDRINSLMVGDYYKIAYTYDFLGRLSTMVTPAGTITYEYNTGQGQVERKLPNGVTTTWEFGANGQQLRTTHADANNYILAEYRYQYRPDGLIDIISEKTQNGTMATKYEYDKVGRSIHVMDQAGSDYKYEYDDLGNRLQSSQDGTIQLSEYDWAGRLTKFNGKACSHDAAGNLNSIVLDGTSMNYQFNTDCQLAKVNEQVFYKYDGNGKLIERQADGITTKFITEPFSDYWQPLEMDNPKDGKTLLIWDKNTPLIMIKNGKPEYFLTDHLCSARLVVDDQGKVKQSIDYKPFGEFKNEVNGNGLNVGFSGLFYDSNAKLYLTKARAYNAGLGQFLQIEPQQRIPKGSQKELTLYTYCGNDPANFTDLNGAWPIFIWGPENWAWQVCHTDWLDRDYANKFYDDLAKKNTGWKGAFIGVMSGIIPGGESYSDQQKLAKAAWSLSDTWKNPISIARDIVGYGLDLKESFQQNKITDELRDRVIGYSIDRYFDFVDKKGIEIIKNNLEKYITKNVLQSTNRTYAYGKKFFEDLGRIKTISEVMPDLVDPISHYLQFNADKQNQRINNANLKPSNVGGVYLGGAGQSLEGLGQLEGLSLDANNNLILIGKKGKKTNLPPMRLDDVVTVFRAVYINGDGPTVTIDPNPQDPKHSAMIIKHDKGTENSYVGWILYQADRLMKTYMLGVDNITSKNLVTNIPGYDEVLNAVYFGNGILNSSKYEGKWERFWIVPAKVNEFTNKNKDLSIFDVPLKLKTQVMKWENGALVDDNDGVSSTGATKFKEWFTNNYNALAKERYLTPPSSFGMKDSIPVFAELQRIAVITALAEKMRDQGIPMPFWMRDYEVKPVQFEKYTPALLVTRNNETTQARIFGGVVLTADSGNVKQFTSTNDIKELPKEDQVNAEANLNLANSLSSVIQEYKPQTSGIGNNTFEIANETY